MTIFRVGLPHERAIASAIGVAASVLISAAQDRPSVTALEVAAYRAIGAKHPDPSIRNADQVADACWEPKSARSLTRPVPLSCWRRSPWKPSVPGTVLEPQCFCPRRPRTDAPHRRCVEPASQHGHRSGRDSRRRPGFSRVPLGDALRNLRVFELRSSSCTASKKRVREVFGELPGRCHLRADRFCAAVARRSAGHRRIRPEEEDVLHLGRGHDVHFRVGGRRDAARGRPDCCAGQPNRVRLLS